MANQRQALVLSCEVPGEEPLPGARYNAEKLSKFFRRAYVDARCVYGGPLTLDRAKEDINDFFSKRCDVHVLYGIFHGCRGSWKLSDGTMLGLRDILEQWDSAIQLGTAQNLLIVSDACESGCMVNEAALLGRGDIAVQASCAGSNSSPDTKGETFTEYLLWNLQGRTTANKRGIDMLVHIERALLTLGPCYYCPDRSNYRGWVFVNEDGPDPSSSQSVSLASDTSDTTSQKSEPEAALGQRSLPPGPQPEDAEDVFDLDKLLDIAARPTILLRPYLRNPRELWERESEAIAWQLCRKGYILDQLAPFNSCASWFVLPHATSTQSKQN